jgi:hypothetical protein
MSIAWTTIIVLAFLLPGVGFLRGRWAQERYSREVSKSSAFGEIAGIIFAAVLIHLSLLLALERWFDFNPLTYFAPFIYYETTPNRLLIEHAIFYIPRWAGYVLATAILGYVLGRLVGWAVMLGPLRGIATHKWAFDLIKKTRSGVVATYVATTTKEGGRVLMYSGHLSQFYLDSNGWFTHVVMANCSSYYMKLEGDKPTTHQRRKLFRDDGPRQWAHLVIPGAQIANVLFEPLGSITRGEDELKALEQALKSLDALMAEARNPDKTG